MREPNLHESSLVANVRNAPRKAVSLWDEGRDKLYMTTVMYGFRTYLIPPAPSCSQENPGHK